MIIFILLYVMGVGGGTRKSGQNNNYINYIINYIMLNNIYNNYNFKCN